jgi:nucleoside-diphosphate-sugar epimerase
MQNFSESYFADPLAAGELALPTGDAREPFVDAEDIADIAVAALTKDGHVGELYELTGPRLLTFAEAVAEIADATSRPLRYQPIPIDAFAADLEAEGIPADVVALLGYPVHRGARRPQRVADRRRPARARPRAARLRRLRPPLRRRRGVELVRGRLTTAARYPAPRANIS